ncbi:hypothetical protein SCAZ3_03365 [Streptococcus canis FSL Z3-227]|uniref:Transposase n=1 Tax=Streptococcus canis FSL Z3-227 TaxID=482234 RepID=A0AAV3FQZ0_STRCB|nr:hypothetical protein SCAZ3_03365 [Streptococcus canis FSL Z3-227]
MIVKKEMTKIPSFATMGEVVRNFEEEVLAFMIK